MRKLLTVMALVITANLGFSQGYLDVGLKGYFGTTWLLHETILNDEDYVHEISLGAGPGFKLGVNFNERVAVVGEVLYFNFNQKYAIKDFNGSWNKHISITTVDLPLLLRTSNGSGSYFEIGGQYSMVRSIEENVFLGEINASDNYDQHYWSAILSFGGYMIGWENFGISMGFRFAYSFDDILTSQGEAGSYTNKISSLPSRKATNPLTAGLVLEFNYDLGYMVKSPCTGRRSFMLFK
ncbi:MAG: hypothetical protein JKY52_06580 [Flavobacteriales bacterium]|nr:hypothetical protein [Flavobacteriales bacterium]